MYWLHNRVERTYRPYRDVLRDAPWWHDYLNLSSSGFLVKALRMALRLCRLSSHDRVTGRMDAVKNMYETIRPYGDKPDSIKVLVHTFAAASRTPEYVATASALTPWIDYGLRLLIFSLMSRIRRPEEGGRQVVGLPVRTTLPQSRDRGALAQARPLDRQDTGERGARLDRLGRVRARDRGGMGAALTSCET